MGGNAKYLFNIINGLNSDEYEIELYTDKNVIFSERARQFGLKNTKINYLDIRPRLFKKNYMQRMYEKCKGSGNYLEKVFEYRIFGYTLFKGIHFIYRKLSDMVTLAHFRYFVCNCIMYYRFLKSMSGEIDIYHYNNGGYPGRGESIISFLFARYFGIGNIVMTVHNLPAERKWYRFMDYICDIVTSKYCKVIIMPSKKLKSEMNKRRQYPLSRMPVIYCGMEDKKKLSNIAIEEKKQELSLNQHFPILLIAGNLDEPRKGHKVLFRALIQVRRKYPDFILLVVGDGRNRNELEKLARTYCIDDNVLFLGYREDIHELNCIADIAVVPSIGFEAIPYTIIETLRAGIPVITTDAGGCDEGAINDLNGLVVSQGCASELAEAILKMLGNDELRSKMGKAGREHFLKEFILSERVRMHEDVYKSLL